MGRTQISEAERIQQLSIGLPMKILQDFEHLAYDLGLSVHELTEAVARMLLQDLTEEERIELLRPHVRRRGRKRYGKKDGKNRKDLLKIIHYAIIMLHVHDTANEKE